MEEREQIAREALVAMRDIIRLAIMTLAALKDPDARFRGYASLPANIVHDVKEAYGYSAARARAWQPSAKDISQLEIVGPWLSWLRREEGEVSIRRIMGWAMGTPIWMLAGRENCSHQTIYNRIDRSIAAIVREFAQADIEIEEVADEGGEAKTSYTMVTEKSPGPHGAVKLAKVFVSGMGFVKNGRVWGDGSERLRKYLA